jgi:hypothetical protein
VMSVSYLHGWNTDPRCHHDRSPAQSPPRVNAEHGGLTLKCV